MKKALILGSTGLVGSHLLDLLLQDEQYEQVMVIVRNRLEIPHPKIQQVVVEDLSQMNQYKDCFHVDDVFCCLGTTMKKAKTKERFKRVDYDLPYLAASISKKEGVQRFLLISSMGADVHSRFFYNRVKGEAEKSIQALHLPAFFIFRPSLLLGKRKESRLGERISGWISKPLSFLMKQKYRPIQAADVASAMHKMAQTYLPGTQIFENDQIHALK
ncbi:NAD-dependent epimerase/dehydratase family protein [Ammoniphilus resinae]|uniref:Uncharacterized protein YbjT (DUF2867 family) n=1 Tax=Ammoniphilus resinae TaxID=861532 RepID=A0ABS4GST6_9BACL|nr:NAD-dependent epimerase/dehydratase family protein [Ammoniphilus resinae]MBP1933345.1 uncharacterized protein YbjT (DUF2867 family) [Ammoniphilus resinae]